MAKTPNEMLHGTIQVKLERAENAQHWGVAPGEVVAIPIEEYIKGVVASEIGNAHIEACKAQAIAARTYALPYETISDQSSKAQAYRAERAGDAAYANAHRGTELTAGLVLYYEGKPLKSCPYSKSNGGRTMSNQERWGSAALPYLPAQDDPWDLAATGGVKSGHGVGMSQEGAKYAASKLGKSCEEILSFYYPGCTIEAEEDTMVGTVVTANGGALNMRKYPGTSADRIARIPNGATLKILNIETIAEGWYEIEYDGVKGYAMAEYISIAETPDAPDREWTVGISFKTKAAADEFKNLLSQAKII